MILTILQAYQAAFNKAKGFNDIIRMVYYTSCIKRLKPSAKRLSLPYIMTLRYTEDHPAPWKLVKNPRGEFAVKANSGRLVADGLTKPQADTLIMTAFKEK
jgi:hypothetical protein